MRSAPLAMIAMFALGCAHHPVTVDASLRALEMHGATAFAFRGDGTGLIGDGWGKVFGTKDSGGTWVEVSLPSADRTTAVEDVDTIAWIDATSAIVHRSGETTIYRTRDSARSFESIPLPSNPMVRYYGAVANGQDVWLCGGELLRSRDGGSTWASTRPPSEHDACRGIAFVDASHGWLVDDSSLFTTDDGGDTWSVRAGVDGATDLVAATTDVAWVLTGKGVLRTTSRGSHLDVVATQANHEPRISDVLGRRIVTLGASSSTERLSPASPRKFAVVDAEHIAVRQNVWHAPHFLIRGPSGTVALDRLPSRVGPPRFEILRREGDVSDFYETTREAVSDRHAYVFAAGLGWLEIAELPAKAMRTVFAGGYGMIAETSNGLSLSYDGARSWSPATNDAWARFELARALGERPASPLACLVDATHGSLTVRVSYESCFGGKSHDLVLSWNGTRATLQGNTIGLAELRALVFRLVTAASKVELPIDGISTAGVSTELSWSCGGAPQTTSFSAIYVDPKEVQPGDKLRRAQQLNAIVDGVLGPLL